MKINTFLEKVCEEIKYKPVRQAISEELEEHLLEIKEEKIREENLTEELAEEQATEQMGEPEVIGKQLNEIHKPKLDWRLLCLLAILMFYGIINIFYKVNEGSRDIGNTILYIIGGIAVGTGLYFFDYRKLQKYSNVIYLIATGMIVLAFIPTSFSVLHQGAQYLSIKGGPMFNPAMISVPLYIIAFAGFLTDSKEKGYLKMIISSLLALGLIFAIPSIANAFILGVTYLVTSVIYIWKTSQNKGKVLTIICGSIATIAILLFTIIVFNNVPVQRILYSFKPEADPQGLGYVGMLQKKVLENAKITGRANTEIITGQNILVEESNYTFIYLMGKLGKLVAGILVIVVGLIAIKIIFNAKLVKDMYGKVAIIGLGTLYVLQSVINILMNLNLGIQTNINLPFVCEGGVYFIINCISMAFILSIYRRKDINLEITKYES